MPSGYAYTIPVPLQLVWELAPRRVLDLGTGYGKYGVLFREYLELRHAKNSPQYNGNGGKLPRTVQIDGVEGFPDYIHDLHRLVYDHIYAENIIDFMAREWEYDFIFIGDVLEHIDKQVASDVVLPRLVRGATMGVLVVVPATFEEQGAVFGNPLEIHRSAWSASDFRRAAPYAYVGTKESHLIAFLTRDRKAYEVAKGRPLRRKVRALQRAFVDCW